MRTRLLGAAGLACAMAASAHAQSADGLLKPAIDDETAAEDAPAPEPRETRLTVAPEEDEEPVERRRSREEAGPYDAQGLRAGAFTLFPSLQTGAAFSTNPALASSNAKSDLGVFIRPALRLTSGWSRHEVSAAADGDFIFFLDDQSADAETFNANGKLRLDARRTTRLELDAAVSLEPSNDPGEDSSGDSGFDVTTSGFAALAHDVGRVTLTGKTGVRFRTFGDVLNVSNDDLDYAEPEASLRAAYELSSAFKPFVEAGYRPRIFFDKRDRNGVARGSQGAFAGTGFTFDPSALWSLTAGANYVLRDYDDSSLKTAGSFGANLSLAWRPSDVAEIEFSASAATSDSSADDIAGNQTYAFTLDASHDLRDNITVNASAGLDIEDTGAGTEEFTYTAGADAIYRLSPWFAFTASYDFLGFDAAGEAGDYTEHRVTAGVELRR